jgi:hypothetical protein
MGREIFKELQKVYGGDLVIWNARLWEIPYFACDGGCEEAARRYL